MADNLENMEIQWHSGFYGAAELELISDWDVLEFHREYNLSKEPLRMDLLIIKKMADVPIKNEIGRIFKTYNVAEFKSPDSVLSIDDYYKTVAYACLYKSMGEKQNQIPAKEVTVTLVRDRYPRELIHSLEAEGVTIEESFPGIYYVKGRTTFDTQIIVTSRLAPESHRSLRLLSKKVSRDDAKAFIEMAEKLTEPGNRNNIEAVLQVSVAANQELYDQIRRESVMYNALRDLLKEEIEEEKRVAVQEAVEKTEQKTEQNTLLGAIKNLMDNLKWTAEQAMDAINIPEEQRAGYRAKL